MESIKYVLLVVAILIAGLFAGSALTGQVIRKESRVVCQDYDQDSYYLNCYSPRDCNDYNRFVYPNAAEICENELDDNCNGYVDELNSCVKINTATKLS